ncbi:acyl-CoA thioesterase [Ningiella sp. W23]|uniref:acyl-CoA thioesterase n=1 Tax=Ningiella sp. W23 TaxID=3023715 RepID=UPI0037579014
MRVRYAECDAQGVVFNSRYGEYADLAGTEYMRALIGDYAKLTKQGFETQVVSYHIDWKGSAKFDDVLLLKVSTCHVGNTSFTFGIQCFKRQRDGGIEKLAEMKVTYVMVDAVHFKKCTIPGSLKQAFAKPFRRSVNQAG